MQLTSAISHQPDIAKAVHSMASKLYKEIEPSFIVCYYTEEYDEKMLSAELGNAFSGIPVHGCCSCRGVMTDEGFHEGPVIAILAIQDIAVSAYGTSIQEFEMNSNKADIVSYTMLAVEDAILDADRKGEVPDLILLHASNGNEELLIEAIKNKFGFHIPLIGGTAADNGSFEKNSFLTEKGSARSGVSVSVFYPSQPISTYFSTGYLPTTNNGIVTKAKGRTVYSINHKPALTVYRNWMREYSKDARVGRYLFDRTTSYPLGRIVDYLYDKPFYKLSHPSKATEDGGIELFTNVNEGERLYLMHGSTELLVKRAGKVVEAANNDNTLNAPLIGGISIFCAGSMVLIKDDMDKVFQSLYLAYKGKPFICPFTFGEQGRFVNKENVHGNLMASTALLYANVIENNQYRYGYHRTRVTTGSLARTATN